MLARKLTKKRDKKTKEDALIVDRLLDLGNVPLKFRSCTLSEIPDTCKYKAPIDDWIDNVKEYVEDGKWLVMTGGFGTGKTAAAAIILKEVVLHDGSAFMLTQNELVDYKLNSDHAPFGHYSLEQIVHEANMLLLDDIGSGRNKEIVCELLEWVCVTRYNNNRSLILTSNLEFDKDKIQEFLTGKVLSMAVEKARLVKVSEVNWREKLKEQKGK